MKITMWQDNRKRSIRVTCGLRLGVLALLFFLLHPDGASSDTQTALTILGNITNIPPNSSSFVRLYSYYGKDLSEEASASVNAQGDFKFELKDKLRQGLYRIGLDKKNAADIVLSGENELYIKADYGQLNVNNITVTGSKENEAYRVLAKEWGRSRRSLMSINVEKSQISTVDPFFNRKIKDIENKVRLLTQEHNVNLLSIKESYPGTFASEVLTGSSLIPQLVDHPDLKESYDNKRAFMHDYFFEHIDFEDERIIYTPYLAKKYFSYLNKFTFHSIPGFKDSVDLLFAKTGDNSAVKEFTIKYLIDTFNKQGVPQLADYVIDNYADGCSTPLSIGTEEKIENIKRLRVGKIAPNIVSNGPDGKPVALSSMAGKGVLMVYFWASWCGGCEAENPNIVRLYNEFHNKGFDVYAVALDKKRAEWLEAIDRFKFTWTNVSDLNEWHSGAAETYLVDSTPTIYLINREGRIAAKNLRGKELKKKLNALLHSAVIKPGVQKP
ncbi:MAG: AhpC/TSA family protein [Planctomycetes bacterium]|nr:AhpC/TSA family protein [Planctomycetota bacterium]